MARRRELDGKEFSGKTRAKGFDSPVSVVPGCSDADGAPAQLARAGAVAWFKAAFDKRYEYQPPARTRRWRRGDERKFQRTTRPARCGMDPTRADRFATDAGRALHTAAARVQRPVGLRDEDRAR